MLVLVSIFMRNQSKITSQKRQQQIIEEQYNDDQKIDEIYEETVKSLPNNGGNNENQI